MDDKNPFNTFDDLSRTKKEAPLTLLKTYVLFLSNSVKTQAAICETVLEGTVLWFLEKNHHHLPRTFAPKKISMLILVSSTCIRNWLAQNMGAFEQTDQERTILIETRILCRVSFESFCAERHVHTNDQGAQLATASCQNRPRRHNPSIARDLSTINLLNLTEQSSQLSVRKARDRPPSDANKQKDAKK